MLDHSPFPADVDARHSDDLAYILYTSGSTGIPKGVMLTHHNAASYVDWCTEVFKPSEEDRFSSHAPFHFDLSILDIYVPIKHGARVDLIPDELGKSPRGLATFISSHKITVWYSTPAILSLLAEFGQLEKFDYSALRLVLFAGEVFPVKQLRKVTIQWPTAAYYNLYGPTETNVCTYAPIPLPISESRTDPYPIGWACSHCKALVLDPENQAVNSGEEGLLYISGPQCFRVTGQGPLKPPPCLLSVKVCAGITPATSCAKMRMTASSMLDAEIEWSSVAAIALSWARSRMRSIAIRQFRRQP